MDNMHYKITKNLLYDFLKDEHTAAQYYQRLIALLDSEEHREIIGKIRDDEIKHAIMLANLYKCLYRCEPEGCYGTEVIPENAQTGVSEAVRNELNAYESYRNTYLMNCDPRARAVFFELMSDEIEHSVWEMYILKNI